MKSPTYAPLFPYLAVRLNAGLLAEGELVIDNFAGIGGASSGIEAALGRPVDHAINHDPVAVSLHRVNHPHSHHSVEDVWHVDPLEVTRGQPVALCWFSPTCTHFSKAKGAALLDRGIRGLAWVAVRWAALVKPRVIILENVEEFRDWCPLLPDGRPDPAQKGRTFNSFVNALRYQGYQVEHRELRACDYGTPTIRKRLFLIARRDGLPIVWPAPTHAAPTDPCVKAGLLESYKSAASCIDWDIPCPSIFDRKKPLVTNTMNRVAQGLRRFVLEAAQPFIVTCNHSGAGFRGQGLDQPFNTITAAHEAHGLTRPLLAPYVVNKQHSNPARSPDAPLSTVTTNHNKNELLGAYFVPRNGEAPGQQARAVDVNMPAATVTTTANGARLVVGQVLKFNTGSVGQSADKPMYTVTTGGTGAAAPLGISTAHFVQHNGGSLPPEDASYSADRPARTVLAQGGPQALVTGALLKTDNQRSWSQCVYPVTAQLPTVVSKNSYGLTTACLTAYYGSNGEGDPGQEADVPLRTIPTRDRFGVSAATLMRQLGTSNGADITAPAPTVMTQGSGGKTGVITVTCWPALTSAELDRAREVHAFLLAYLGEGALAPYSRDGLVVLNIRGEWYVLADIGMRMLSPRELARCQGFPDSFVLERDAEGKSISKARQVRGIGNSVCPQLAQVLTHAQLSAVVAEAAD
ncbi:DNA cytosine methyltransferase [Deinococcus marmoris]|uniref:DNA (cytosine-5-)-methyltransferase n=1 Tax=Deinococcus marmoris TaxID=249408 RepID=A0A1U7P4S3_9DEIO|nr:DNA cytosine methyltransferase [Deinococcus marmoris]OLV20158.1 C-5 cytosine-specific DNA methylase family protein [Deinococcus marmoris]